MKRQRGAAATEYLVGLAIVIAALFVPVPGSGDSLINWFMETLSAFQASTTFLMSIP